ncbi:MAG: four helix bundle protein [Melioribacter sp.]|nr:four helix bundle protein [Melioribacter sp.]
MNEEKKYLKLNDIESYKTGFKLSNYIWDIVIKWNFFDKDTVGKQFTRAIDSISANISEGFGRYYKKDKILFYRYAKGSVFESLDWNEKSKARNLITMEQYNYIFSVLQKLPKQINELISYTNIKLTK